MPMNFRALLLALAVLPLTHAASAASDFQFTLAANGFSAYQFASVSSPDVYAGPLSADNPTLNLIVGKRYGVTNPDAGFHPFELVARGANSLEDVVLLSEGAAGSLEADPAIAWSDDGAGHLEFTVTAALASALSPAGKSPGYRCAFHGDSMRGAVALFNNGSVITNPIAARIPPGAMTIETQLVAEGLVSPLGAAFAADGRMFICDQIGVVRVVQNGVLLPDPFLDVRSRLVTLSPGYDERGLLGFALHPEFALNGKVYTWTSEPATGTADYTVAIAQGASFNHQDVLTEWQVGAGTPNQIDPASRRELLRLDHPQGNHNGGSIRFGPDGYLYVGTGDGGGAHDSADGHGPEGNGQKTTVALGKILRLDVAGTNAPNGRYGIPGDNPFVASGGLKEIYLYGLRNPYAFSFDFTSGLLYVGDVGQGNIEEVNAVAPAQKGSNLGWNIKEGSFYFTAQAPNVGKLVSAPTRPLHGTVLDPVAEYDHDDGPAVVGGFVYRGSALESLFGRYVFGDLGTGGNGRLFYLDPANQIRELRLGQPQRPLGGWLKGFAQDGAGEIYVCVSSNIGPSGTSGKVLRLTAPPPQNAVRPAWWQGYQ